MSNSKAQDENPVWSADGGYIVSVSTRDGHSQLYIMKADGSEVLRLTNNTAQDQLPIWLSH